MAIQKIELFISALLTMVVIFTSFSFADDHEIKIEQKKQSIARVTGNSSHKSSPLLITANSSASNHDISDQADNSNSLQVAILPWRPRSSSSFGIILNVITKEIKKYNNLSLTFSYYDLHNQPSVKKITSEIVDEKRLSELWKKENLFSKTVPDIAKVVEIGKMLEVDQVIMGEYRISEQGVHTWLNYIDIYIVDVNDQSVKKYRNDSRADLYKGNYDTIYKVVSEAFMAFN